MRIYRKIEGVWHFHPDCEIVETAGGSFDAIRPRLLGNEKVCQKCLWLSKENNTGADDGSLDAELSFTRAFRENAHMDKSLREARIYEEKLPLQLHPLENGDLLAGRKLPTLVSFELNNASGGALYYLQEEKLEEVLRTADFSDKYRSEVSSMLEYWLNSGYIITGLKHHRNNPIYKAMWDEFWRVENNGNGILLKGSGRLVDNVLDYDKLLAVGIEGLREEVALYRNRNKGDQEKENFYEAMENMLVLFSRCCHYYEEQIMEMYAVTACETRRSELKELAGVLSHIAAKKPQSFYEAVQLSFLYSVVSGTESFGRMDAYLGEFLAHDLEKGTLSQEKAQRIVNSLWTLIAARGNRWTDRVFIGGKGRRNEKNADRFALLAMEATKSIVELSPQLTLRMYEGMDERIADKAFEVIGAGRQFPMLLNDDVNIPAIQNAMNVSAEDAQDYFAYGCGEYTIPHKASTPPNGNILVLKALELALHNGNNILDENRFVGLRTGELDELDTFDKLYQAYKTQVEYAVDICARAHAVEYTVEEKLGSYLFVSALFDRCVESGKPYLEAAKYKGGQIEIFGLTNTADSLFAIRKLVYEQKLFSLRELVTVLDRNFEGYEDVRKMLLEMPKFGNDNHEADAMAHELSDHISKYTWDAARKVGFNMYNVVNVNNEMNVKWGGLLAASAVGRRQGEPMANGMTPTAGRDRNGLTAVLKSMASVNPCYHAGYVHNLKLDQNTFNKDMRMSKALIRTYFKLGGTQVMITVVDKGDLERAMVEPEKYSHIIVRVGGFCERFVNLSRDVQMDILNRTLH